MQQMGAGVVNGLRSRTQMAASRYEYGGFPTSLTSFESSFNVPSQLNDVHVSLCTLKPNILLSSGVVNNIPGASYQIKVTSPPDSSGATQSWISWWQYDNKVKIVFTPPRKGTYRVTITRYGSVSTNTNFGLTYGSLS